MEEEEEEAVCFRSIPPGHHGIRPSKQRLRQQTDGAALTSPLYEFTPGSALPLHTRPALRPCSFLPTRSCRWCLSTHTRIHLLVIAHPLAAHTIHLRTTAHPRHRKPAMLSKTPAQAAKAGRAARGHASSSTSPTALLSEMGAIEHLLARCPHLAPADDVDGLLTRLVDLCIAPYSADFAERFFAADAATALCRSLRSLCATAEAELERHWVARMLDAAAASEGTRLRARAHSTALMRSRHLPRPAHLPPRRLPLLRQLPRPRAPRVLAARHLPARAAAHHRLPGLRPAPADVLLPAGRLPARPRAQRRSRRGRRAGLAPPRHEPRPRRAHGLHVRGRGCPARRACRPLDPVRRRLPGRPRRPRCPVQAGRPGLAGDPPASWYPRRGQERPRPAHPAVPRNLVPRSPAAASGADAHQVLELSEELRALGYDVLLEAHPWTSVVNSVVVLRVKERQ